MATPAAVLSVLLTANTAGATAALSKYQGQLETTNKVATASMDKNAVAAETSASRQSKAFSSAGTAITSYGKKAALGLAGVAAGATVLAVKFQQSTELLQTQAGASTKQVDELRKGMLAMAGAVGQTPDNLAKGMYHVVSSMNALLPPAQRVNTELHVLKIAAEGAAVGHTDLESTTYALASAMNALHAPVGDASKIMGEMNAIVGAGDMTMSDLLATLHTGLIPAAKTFGVSFQSIGAALAVFGDMGIQGAKAGTQLRMSIALLAAPSSAAAKILMSLGLSSSDAMARTSDMAKALTKAGVTTTQLGVDLRKPNGLMVALKDLRDHLIQGGLTANEAAATISRAFGGGKSGAAIQLLSQNTDRLKAKFDQIGQTAGNFGGAFAKTQKTVAFQLETLKAGTAALGIQLGSVLLPTITAVVGAISSLVRQFQQGNPVVVASIAAVVGLTVALGAAAIAASVLDAALAILASPVILTVAAIGALVGALVILYLKVKVVHDFLNAAWMDMKDVAVAAWHTIRDTVSGVIDGIEQAVRGGMKVIQGVIDVFSGIFQGNFSKMWQGIKEIFSGGLDAILGIIKATYTPLFNAGKLIISGLAAGFKSAFVTVTNTIIDFLNTIIGVLDKIPFVNIGKISHIGGSGASGPSSLAGPSTGSQTSTAGHQPGHARGGMVNTPGYFAGEEAPRHPEVILATNPAYRARNRKLWAQAGGMLGMPGFAAGGVVGTAGTIIEGAGFTKAAAAAILGNAYQESSWNPTAGDSSAGGLWGFTSGNKSMAALFAYAASRGVPWQSPATQTMFMLGPAGGEATKGTMNSLGIDAATAWFMTNWEAPRVSTENLARRIQGAHIALGILGGKAPATGVLAGIGSAISGVAGLGAGALKALLPSAPHLPDWLSGLGPWLLKRAGSFITDKAGSVFSGGGGGGVSPGAYTGPNGAGSFDGLTVADWIVPILQWAAGHGWHGRITSGYRPGAITTSGNVSNHSSLTYPGGAVDVGDQFAMTAGLALWDVVKNYPGSPKLYSAAFGPGAWGPYGGSAHDYGHFSATGHRKGGIYPYAGAFGQGGIVPHDGMALVHKGEAVIPGFAKGGLGKPTSVTLQTPSSSPTGSFGLKGAGTGRYNAAVLARLLAALGIIPSQGVGGQIKLAGLQNAVTAAQNVGNVGGQIRGLTGELTLEKQWLSADKAKLRKINAQLSKRGLSPKTRGALLQDKLALLQEIGTVEGNIGSIEQSIGTLATSPTGSAGGDPNQPLIDALAADAAARVAQTQALQALKVSLDTQTTYMKSIGEIEKRQAIAALSDVISGQIGGNYFSRATGSAGDGSVARYGSVARA